MKILYFVNYIRTFPVVVICMALNLNKIIEEDFFEKYMVCRRSRCEFE